MADSGMASASGLQVSAAPFTPATGPKSPVAASGKGGALSSKLAAAASAAPFVPGGGGGGGGKAVVIVAPPPAGTSPPAPHHGHQQHPHHQHAKPTGASSKGGGSKGKSGGGSHDAHKASSFLPASLGVGDDGGSSKAKEAATRAVRSPVSSAGGAANAALPAASPNRLGSRGGHARSSAGSGGARGTSAGSLGLGSSGGYGSSGARGHHHGGGLGGAAAAAAAAAAGALGGPPGLGPPAGGAGGGGAGGRGGGLLAQHQSSYGGYGGGAHHHHHGGPGRAPLAGQFMPEGLRQQLQHSNYLVQLQYSPSADEPPLPERLGHFHTLAPLEDLTAGGSSSEPGGAVSAAWGVATTCLKGINSRDGRPTCLRVICGKQVIPSLEMLGAVRSAVEAWSALSGHPGLLVPHEGLVASELDGCPSLVVAADYVPGALTLAQAHLQPTQAASGQLVRNTPTEELLWSYTTQLAGMLRAVHSMGLALRPASLSATKVLVTPIGRLKCGGLGVCEALAGEVVPANSDALLQLQRDDVVAMGQLLLQLACAGGSLAAPSLDFASMHHSPEFVRLLMLLIGVADGGGFSWRAVSALLGERLLLEMDALAMFNEQLLESLTRESENGRLFRLMAKLAFVTDRSGDGAAGAAGGAGWAETGDRYLLALFRDFVFHQGERDGGRSVDWGHILEALNKLDAGVGEQVLLQSRDERSLLVVSYADIKRCVEAAVSEIRTRGPGGSGAHAAAPGLARPPAHHAGGGGLYRGHHHTGMHAQSHLHR